MIYKYSPKRSSPFAAAITATLYILSVVLFGCSVFGLKPASLLQLASVCALTFAVLLTTRYLFTSYVYAIEENGDFSVTQTTGKKITTVCLISLDDIAQIVDYSGRTPEKGIKINNYCADMFPAKAMLLILKKQSADGRVGIKFQPDAQMSAIITAHINKTGL